ncbi:MAG: GTP-binding protein [Promethearchaeota archaeon]|nr:MAG: GTP-binding protein [Candidatus Lokiarchaeota archaeon]
MQDAFSKGGNKVEYHDYYKYRISYISVKDYGLMFLFVTGLTDNFDNIKKELTKCKKEFLNLFEDIIQHKHDSKTFEVFDPTIDSIHRNLRPKISLVGFSGVGKTTITRLIKAEEIPMQHIPTITGDIATIKIGKLHFHLWDFAGQEQFSYLWNNFIKGSDAVLLITDSSLENVEKSKFFLELIKEQAPNAHTAIIGNKQDLDESMKPEQIEKILGLKTYSMIAKNPDNRDRMIQIVADILEMSAEVSPLLKPLLERDTYIEEATQALENAEFEKSASLFEKISDLCLELGDDSLGREFYEKGQKIRSMLEKVSSIPAEPKEEEVKIEQMINAEEKPKVKEKLEVEKEASQPPAKEKEPVISEKKEVKEEKAVPTLKPVKVPVPPPPPTKTTPKVETEAAPAKETKIEESTSSPPETLEEPISLVKDSTFKKIDIAIKESNDAKEQVEPTVAPQKLGLELNPQDFMVKQRPKTVTEVPKDAKHKLKTSPYAHVSNPEKGKTPVPINPVNLIKPKSFIPPKAQGMQPNKTTPKEPELAKKDWSKILPASKTPVSPSTPSPPKPTAPEVQPPPKQIPTPSEASTPVNPISKPSPIPSEPTPTPEVSKETPPQIDVPQPEKVRVDSQQKAELEKSLMDLKVKKANISKMALDLDMKELTGEITPGELEEKKGKLEKIEKSINEQIKDIEEMLK